MGRRKIAIQPLTDERNRSVTFLKRKAGLFKKAHELAVLCQVDIAVIIFGHNKKLYEFSSSNTNGIIERYRVTQPHEKKTPQDFDKSLRNKNSRLQTSKTEATDDEDEDDGDDGDSETGALVSESTTTPSPRVNTNRVNLQYPRGHTRSNSSNSINVNNTSKSPKPRHMQGSGGTNHTTRPSGLSTGFAAANVRTAPQHYPQQFEQNSGRGYAYEESHLQQQQQQQQQYHFSLDQVGHVNHLNQMSAQHASAAAAEISLKSMDRAYTTDQGQNDYRANSIQNDPNNPYHLTPSSSESHTNIPSRTSSRPEIYNSKSPSPLMGNSYGQTPSSSGMRPKLKVEIPPDQSKDTIPISSDDHAQDQEGSSRGDSKDQASSSNTSAQNSAGNNSGGGGGWGSALLPPPHSPGYLNGPVGIGPGNPFGRPPLTNGEQTPLSAALPSRYMNMELLPSPSNFYSNEWNLQFGSSGGLPSAGPNGLTSLPPTTSAGTGISGSGTAVNSQFQGLGFRGHLGSDMLLSPLQFNTPVVASSAQSMADIRPSSSRDKREKIDSDRTSASKRIKLDGRSR